MNQVENSLVNIDEMFTLFVPVIGEAGTQLTHMLCLSIGRLRSGTITFW